MCIHPTVLLQILQLWVPSSEQLDAALMSSLRPMLPHVFDAEAERVTIRILGALSRFENADDLGEETITSILLSDAVRTRVAATGDIEEDIEIIKSALVKQNRILEVDRRRLRRETEGLEGKIRLREGEVAKLGRRVEQLEEERRRDKGRMSQEEGERERLAARVEESRSRAECLECTLIGVVAAAAAGIASWRLGAVMTGSLGSHPVVATAFGGLLTLLGGVGCPVLWMTVRKRKIREKPAGRMIRRMATWLGVLIAGTLIVVVVELIAADVVRRP